MAAAIVKLNPNARRMAVSMKKLMGNIARRDAKAANSTRPARIIFPTTDTVLQAALTTVMNQLNSVINPTS